jgi:outer membrane biosynthesis protein TonB
VIRRSFRIGLLLGVFAGLAFALVKVLGLREEEATAPPAPDPEPWPRLSTPVATEPAPVMTAPVEEILEPVPGPIVATTPTKKVAKKAAKKKAPAKPWVEPKDGVCPTSHPVKAKLASKIFHLPGMLNYDRTNPDRCYADEKKAEADGLRAAKR